MSANRNAMLLAAFLCQLGLAQPSPTILDILGENWVAYYQDIFDFSKMSSNSGISIALRPSKPFQSFTDITDIVAVNGRPAKGVWINRGSSMLRLSPTAVSGAAMPSSIADVTRSAVVQHYLEILQMDGTPIGTITATGMNFGAPPPGAPAAILRDNVVVTGGTGAFFGARGQAGNGRDSGGANARVASITEDPANRRVNGGGSHRFTVYLIPMSRPEIVSTPTGPAIFHPDFSPVSAAKPARTGEVVIFRATGLGPTGPGVDPGQPFPSDVLQQVNSPVDVTVNGIAAEVINKVGWPGTRDFRLDIRIPDGTSPGSAVAQITAAWIAGSEFTIPIQ